MSNNLPKYFNVPFALHHGYFRCIRYLLQLRYDPNERDNQLRTPLILCSYIENDRWSILLAQNLLEKGARVALEDHARRNALHHACALQRVSLVKLYLSCLDFNIDAQDCEGNTCLHYAALNGNSEIADLLMKSAEKMNIHLDQYVNREGSSAAALALKYGYIDCANQITHRDTDEFFVVPRPLSIYEILPSNADIQKSLSKKSSSKSHQFHSLRRPTSLSFNLLKIVFNENDGSFSSQLAGLCRQDQQQRRKDAQQSSIFDPSKSTLISETVYSSTEALVNESQSRQNHHNKEKHNSDHHSSLSFIQATSSRTQLSINDIQQLKAVTNKFVNFDGLQNRSSFRNMNNLDQSLLNRIQSTRIPLSNKDTSTTNRSVNVARSHSMLGKSGSSTTSTSTMSKYIDSSLSIREAKHRNSRYCQPEILFGIRPEQLFADEHHQPKIIDNRSSMNPSEISSGLKRPSKQKNIYTWQNDYEPLTALYSIQQSSNYRKTAVPPPTFVHSVSTSHNSSHHDHSSTHGQHNGHPHGHNHSHGHGNENGGHKRNPAAKHSSQSKHTPVAPPQLSNRQSVRRASVKVSHA